MNPLLLIIVVLLVIVLILIPKNVKNSMYIAPGIGAPSSRTPPMPMARWAYGMS